MQEKKVQHSYISNKKEKEKEKMKHKCDV